LPCGGISTHARQNTPNFSATPIHIFPLLTDENSRRDDAFGPHPQPLSKGEGLGVRSGGRLCGTGSANFDRSIAFDTVVNMPKSATKNKE
jgi:hypothetical protein